MEAFDKSHIEADYHNGVMYIKKYGKTVVVFMCDNYIVAMSDKRQEDGCPLIIKALKFNKPEDNFYYIIGKTLCEDSSSKFFTEHTNSTHEKAMEKLPTNVYGDVMAKADKCLNFIEQTNQESLVDIFNSNVPEELRNTVKFEDALKDIPEAAQKDPDVFLNAVKSWVQLKSKEDTDKRKTNMMLSVLENMMCNVTHAQVLEVAHVVKGKIIPDEAYQSEEMLEGALCKIVRNSFGDSIIHPDVLAKHRSNTIDPSALTREDKKRAIIGYITKMLKNKIEVNSTVEYIVNCIPDVAYTTFENLERAVYKHILTKSGEDVLVPEYLSRFGGNEHTVVTSAVTLEKVKRAMDMSIPNKYHSETDYQTVANSIPRVAFEDDVLLSNAVVRYFINNTSYGVAVGARESDEDLTILEIARRMLSTDEFKVFDVKDFQHDVPKEASKDMRALRVCISVWTKTKCEDNGLSPARKIAIKDALNDNNLGRFSAEYAAFRIPKLLEISGNDFEQCISDNSEILTTFMYDTFVRFYKDLGCENRVNASIMNRIMVYNPTYMLCASTNPKGTLLALLHCAEAFVL